MSWQAYNSTLDVAVARNLRRLRLTAGMTTADLVQKIEANGGKLDRQVIGKIERTERGVRLDELMLIATALGVPHTELLDMTVCPECRGTGFIASTDEQP